MIALIPFLKKNNFRLIIFIILFKYLYLFFSVPFILKFDIKIFNFTKYLVCLRLIIDYILMVFLSVILFKVNLKFFKKNFRFNTI